MARRAKRFGFLDDLRVVLPIADDAPAQRCDHEDGCKQPGRLMVLGGKKTRFSCADHVDWFLDGHEPKDDPA